jgi:hypothetical protein
VIWCGDCDDFEFRRDHPAWALLLTVLPRPKPSPFAAVSQIFTAALGGPALSHYDRHYRAYVYTGEPRELERMLRQVRC